MLPSVRDRLHFLGFGAKDFFCRFAGVNNSTKNGGNLTCKKLQSQLLKREVPQDRMQLSILIGKYYHSQSSGPIDKYNHSTSDIIATFYKMTLFLNHKIPLQM